MPSFMKWSTVFWLQLATCILARPTTPGDKNTEEASSSALFPRAGTETASVAVSKLVGGLYWLVIASVNGRDVTVMVDTGSSDL